MSNVKKGLIGSVLLIVEAIGKKLIGLISTLILARVLVPEDFGLVAIATIIIGFLDVFSQTGAQQYILRAESVDDSKLNTAFTITLLIKSAIAITLILISGYISDYYSDERLQPILIVLSSLMVVGSLSNPGTLLLQRDQNFFKIVKVTISSKIVGVITAISIAVIFESYWALILGTYASTLWRIIGTYLIHPHRPKLELKNAKEQWKFSGWVIPQSLMGQLRTQFDTFMVSSQFGKAELGSYHTMKYLAFIPCSEILLPATQPLLVQLAKIKDNKLYFNTQYNVSFIVTMAIAFPISIFLYTHHQIIVNVLLGEQWVKYSELFSVFALIIPAYSMFHHANRATYIFAATKAAAIYEFASVSILFSLLYSFTFEATLEFAVLRVGIETLLSTLLLFLITIRYCGVKTLYKLIVFTAPLLLISIVASYISSLLPPVKLLLVDVISVSITFTATYTGLLILLILILRTVCEEWQYISELILRGLANIMKARGKYNHTRFP